MPTASLEILSQVKCSLLFIPISLTKTINKASEQLKTTNYGQGFNKSSCETHRVSEKKKKNIQPNFDLAKHLEKKTRKSTI